MRPAELALDATAALSEPCGRFSPRPLRLDLDVAEFWAIVSAMSTGI